MKRSESLLRPPLRRGESAAYRVRYQMQTRSELTMVGLPQAFGVTLELTLNLTHLPFTHGLLLTVTACRFIAEGLGALEERVRTALQSCLQIPCAITYTPPFQLQNGMFLPPVAPLAQEVLRQLACWFQIAEASQTSWKLTERWVDREVWATYELVERTAHRRRFRKTWETRPTENPDIMAPLAQLAAHYTIDYDSPTQSLVALEGALRLTSTLENLGVTEYQITLRQTQSPQPLTRAEIRRAQEQWSSLQKKGVRRPILQKLTYDEFNAQLYREALRDFTLERAKQRLREANHIDRPVNDNTLFTQLRAFFALYPKQLPAFLQWFVSIEPSDYLVVFVLACLLAASEYTPALGDTQRAAIQLLERFAARKEVITQFLNLLAMLKRTSLDLLAYVWRQAQRVPPTPEDLIQANWILSAGGMVRLAPNHPVAVKIMQWLRERLTHATEPRMQGLYLSALGNSAQPTILPWVRPFAAHPNPWLRRQAVSALRFLELPDAQALLWHAATTDQDATVRREACRALGFHREPVPLIHVVEAFCREQEPEVQQALWDLAQKHTASQPEARALFQRMTLCARSESLHRQILTHLQTPPEQDSKARR